MTEEGEQEVLDADGHPIPDNDQKMWAVFAHLGPIVMMVTGLFMFLAPLVIWLVKKDEEGQEFVADQARESLNFQITVLGALIVSALLSCIVIGLFLLPVVLIGNVVMCVIAALKVNEGVRYRYPWCLRLIP